MISLALAWPLSKVLQEARSGAPTALYMNSLFLGSMAGTAGMGVIASLYGFRAVIMTAAWSQQAQSCF
ncbi:hypothetical protein ACDY96_24945 [Rhizobium mongolense]|uniref:hypothetical protein n=1 Tax=Rhizobium mongolense TaxID=57676 RepID=UPI003558C365